MQNHFVVRALVAASTLMLAPGAAQAQSQPASPPALRDGSHDMDFNFGTWHTEIIRYPDPFGDPSKTLHMAGTVTVQPVWNGKAQLEEIEADGSKGHWEGMTVFLYDPQAHQWSQNFVSASVGRFDSPSIGEYRNGNIEYYAQDESKGRAVLLRGVWSDIKPNSHSYEEDLSDDGGRTWHAAFIAHLTRIGR
jgi:hypothetical protein